MKSDIPAACVPNVQENLVLSADDPDDLPWENPFRVEDKGSDPGD